MRGRIDFDEWGATSWSLLFGTIAFSTAVWGFYCLRRARATLRWRAADGHITWSTVEKLERNNAWGRNRRQWIHFYRPDIQYKYSVGSNDYTGTRLWFGSENPGTESSARAIANRYAVDTRLKVFYNPENPAEAVVRRGHEDSAWKTFMVSTAFGVAAMIAILS